MELRHYLTLNPMHASSNILYRLPWCFVHLGGFPFFECCFLAQTCSFLCQILLSIFPFFSTIQLCHGKRVQKASRGIWFVLRRRRKLHSSSIVADITTVNIPLWPFPSATNCCPMKTALATALSPCCFFRHCYSLLGTGVSVCQEVCFLTICFLVLFHWVKP